jgi:integrase
MWGRACTPQPLFEDEGGELAELSMISRSKYAKGWGRWLTFLAEHDSDALKLEPADRCSKARLQAYVDHLRRSANSEGTIVNRLQELAVVAKAMAPGFDPRLVNRYISAVRSKAAPVRSKAHVPPADALLDLGLRLMAGAASEANSLDQAVTFRDGLVVAFLTMHPIRRRNLADFKIGRNLIRQGDGYMVVFAASETKNGTPYENRLADVIVEPMKRYLAVFRPVLAARTGRWTRDVGDAVWVSADGSPMTQEGLSGRIDFRTREAFGKSVSLHRFRDSAASALAVRDPARVRVAAPLLGHRSLATTEKHYIQATGLEAQRSFLEVIEQVRRDRR